MTRYAWAAFVDELGKIEMEKTAGSLSYNRLRRVLRSLLSRKPASPAFKLALDRSFAAAAAKRKQVWGRFHREVERDFGSESPLRKPFDWIRN